MTTRTIFQRRDGTQFLLDMPRVPVEGETIEVEGDGGYRIQLVKWLVAGETVAAKVFLGKHFPPDPS